MNDGHPIESLMRTTLENMKRMVDVETIIGAPIHTEDGATILPISKVGFGFVSGGGEYGETPRKSDAPAMEHPFAGGTGAGVSISPMAFLIVRGDSVRVAPASFPGAAERLIEMAPVVLDAIRKRME